MYKYLKTLVAASIAMETETIQNNGVSPKDLIMSRGNARPVKQLEQDIIIDIL
jgi:hypothetical protein